MNTILPLKESIKAEIKKDEVLFVCTGNTCRSPMCAALYNRKYAGLTSVGLSAGLSADGLPISKNAVLALREHGVQSDSYNNYESHISRTVTREMLESASIVVGVSSSHAMTLIMRFPEFASKITSFARDITDPFGGDEECYKRCLADIDIALGEMFASNKGS